MSATDDPLRQDLHDLYSNHHGWLKRWLHKRLGNRCDADDLAHDTFLRIIKGRLAGGLHEPRGYLVTIARGLVIDLFRRRSLERQYQEALVALPPLEWPSEEAHALIIETLMQLDAMLDGLGDKAKQVFILSQFEGLIYAQIADRLGISLRTVNSYMARAMEHCCLFRLQQERSGS